MLFPGLGGNIWAARGPQIAFILLYPLHNASPFYAPCVYGDGQRTLPFRSQK